MMDPYDMSVLRLSEQQKHISNELQKMIQSRIMHDSIAALTAIFTPEDLIRERTDFSRYYKGLEPSFIVVDEVVYDYDIVEFAKQNLKSENLWTPYIANLQDFKNQSLIKEIRNLSPKHSNRSGAPNVKMLEDSIKTMHASLAVLSKKFSALVLAMNKGIGQNKPFKFK